MSAAQVKPQDETSSYRKVNREDIYNEVVNLIQNHNGEAEIANSELAKKFDIQGPSLDYHLKHLVEEGKLVLSPKRGRYNRKIYRLPSGIDESPNEITLDKPSDSKTEIHTPFLNQESLDKFDDFINEHLKKSGNVEGMLTFTSGAGKSALLQAQMESDLSRNVDRKNMTDFTDSAKDENTNYVQEAGRSTREKADEVYNVESPKPITQKPEPVVTEDVTEPEAYIEKPEPIQVKELTLEDEIQNFLNASSQVNDANTLLQHEDREILSVMNETIQQTTVYLKDLSEQLSTIQNKQLIQHLIDDRNRTQEQMKRLEKEVEEAYAQANQTKEKYEIEPDRVRFMHQMIVATVDNFVNQQNHSMALNRLNFRNQISKEVSDLVKYVLRIEE
ncbi:ArsR family transcriptional regulator [Priestia megaterium]|uniref:ArsR family transcriptional regulator n=1 Tax=Priestia megaterium TaxID=1404 RepID=UPI001CB89D16|nr:ArsR family transcriptional regulator [Priestia megaterium]